jgi:uncharacterized membrane protein YkvA (DUF1232 family)
MADERLTLRLNERERRVYDRLRAQLVAREPGAGTGLLDLMLLLPDAVVFLLRLLRDDRVSLGTKAVAMASVGYILSPIDLLPEFIFGPFGLVDDLLILAAGLSVLVNRVHPDLVRHHWPGQEDALEAIQRITGWAETQLAGGVWRILKRVLGSASPS